MIPLWLQRMLLYVMAAGVLLLTGYTKGCTDASIEFKRFKAEMEAQAVAQAKHNAERVRQDRLDKERRDADYKRNVARLKRDLDRLRQRARTSVVPPAPAEARDPSRATFDRAELDRALREFTGETAELIGEGAAAIEGLDSLK